MQNYLSMNKYYVQKFQKALHMNNKKISLKEFEKLMSRCVMCGIKLHDQKLIKKIYNGNDTKSLSIREGMFESLKKHQINENIDVGIACCSCHAKTIGESGLTWMPILFGNIWNTSPLSILALIDHNGVILESALREGFTEEILNNIIAIVLKKLEEEQINNRLFQFNHGDLVITCHRVPDYRYDYKLIAGAPSNQDLELIRLLLRTMGEVLRPTTFCGLI